MAENQNYEKLSQRLKALEQELLDCRESLGQQYREKNTAQKYLDIAGVIIVAINSGGEVTLINRRGCEILGRDEKEIIGKNWFENFVPESVRAEVKAGFLELMAGRMENIEYFQNPVLTKHGQERLIAWYNTRVTDDEGNIVGSLSSGEDVTERARVEDALRKAHEELFNFNQDLERIVQERTEELRSKAEQLIEAERLAALGKIANRVAHELRNPLTVVGGLSRRLLDKTPDRDPSKKYLRVIVREVEVLETRVSEIIRIEREAGI